MPVKKVNNDAKKAVSRRGASSGPARAAAASRKPVNVPVSDGRSNGRRDAQDRAKVLSERFHPEALAYLKKTFGLDLENPRIPVSVLYDIAAGRVTEPLELVVTPLAWSRADHKAVEMPPLKVVASMRFVLPYEKGTYKPVAPSKEHGVFVASYPCYEYLQKAEPDGQAVSPVGGQSGRSSDAEELPKFGAEQVMALEGLGIREERLYAGAFNSLAVDNKRAILAGEPFEVNGSVRVSDGDADSRVFVNVAGRARMVTADDGTVRTRFEARYPVEQRADSILDIMTVRRVGNIELDFFERDVHGRMKTDVSGVPVLNAAGRDLVRYGQCFCPVDGFVHERSFNNETRSFEDTVHKEKYQVSVVNGGLCVTEMVKVNDLDRDGNKVVVKNSSGEEVEKYHYEVKNSGVNRDGQLRAGSQLLSPRSAKDLDSYRRGQGGAFDGYVSEDRRSGKKSTYTVFAAPDNRRGGLPKLFSEKVSKELIPRLDAGAKPARKQNFGMGL